MNSEKVDKSGPNSHDAMKTKVSKKYDLGDKLIQASKKNNMIANKIILIINILHQISLQFVCNLQTLQRDAYVVIILPLQILVSHTNYAKRNIDIPHTSFDRLIKSKKHSQIF